MPPLPEARALAVRLAALLHDADDRKYFPDTCKTYANARQIMSEAGAAEAEVETDQNLFLPKYSTENLTEYSAETEYRRADVLAYSDTLGNGQKLSL